MFIVCIICVSLVRADLDTLFKWCVKDEHCSQAYHITDMLQEADEAPEIAVLEKCESVFVFLAERWVHELRPPASLSGMADLRAAVERRFHFRHFTTASATEIEQSVRTHWLLLLRLSASENRQVHCGTNERLVISPETMDAFCDCIQNRNCDDGGNWRSHMNLAQVSTIAVLVLFAFYLVSGIVHHFNKIHFFQEYKMGQRSVEETQANLIKGE